MRKHGIAASVAVAVLTSAVTVLGATASVPRNPLSVMLSIGRVHDDNVLQLTRQNLDLFANRPGPPRFRVSQIGDMATTADAALRWRARPWRRRETRIELAAGLHRYDHDRIADWEEYGVSAAQELTASRRQLLIMDVWAARIPDYYLGEITDLDESVALGDRLRQSLTYEQVRYGVRLHQDHLRGHLELSAMLERIHRGYNRHFIERDNDNDLWRLQASLAPFPRWDGSVRVGWSRGDLNAKGDLPDALGVPDRDISYDHDGVGVGLTLPWGRGRWRGRIDGSYAPESRRYTTTDKFDILRFGRENHRRDRTLRVTQRLWGPVDGIATWQRLTSDAEFHEGITFPAEQTNFAQEKIGVELRARWELPSR